MSQAVEKTLPVGPVQLYWGDVRLGGPKSAFTVRHNTETVQSKQEDTGLNVGSHKTGETMEVDVVISEFKLHQLRYVYAAADEFASTLVINSVAYDASTSTVMRFNESHLMSGTANATVDQAGYMTGTIKVFKSDFSNLDIESLIIVLVSEAWTTLAKYVSLRNDFKPRFPSLDG